MLFLAPLTGLTSVDPEDYRASFRVVRLDVFEDLPGLIVQADAEVGIALMQVRAPSDGDCGKDEFVLGSNGLRILPR